MAGESVHSVIGDFNKNTDVELLSGKINLTSKS